MMCPWADSDDGGTARERIELHAADDEIGVTVEVEVAAGGRIGQVWISRGAESVALLAPPPPDARPWSSAWGSFPMAPWAGRIRNGRFDTDGATIHLDVNHDDGGVSGGAGIQPAVPLPDGPLSDADRRRHSIHGTTFARPWRVESVGRATTELSCSLEGALAWPFAGTARQRLSVTPTSLTCTLSVETDGRSFPAAIGWHPWFDRSHRLDVAPAAMYELDDVALPTGRLVEPGPGPWDDCFVNHEPVVLHYARDLAPSVTVSSDCDHLVIYDRPAHATCVEPQSGPPDAPNIRPELVEPDHPLRRTMIWSW